MRRSEQWSVTGKYRVSSFNLVRIGQLKAEPCNALVVMRMLAMVRTRLADAQLGNLSIEGRFTSGTDRLLGADLVDDFAELLRLCQPG